MSKKFKSRKFRFKPNRVQELILTDLTMHTTNTPATTNAGKVVERSFRSNKPGRFVPANIEYEPTSDGKFHIKMDSLQNNTDFQRYVAQQRQRGIDVRITVPANLPIYAGNDTQEFINSKNGKRLLKGLAKNNKPD